MNPTESSASHSSTSAPVLRADDPIRQPSRTAAGDPTRQKIRQTASQAIDQTKEKVSAAADHGKEVAARRIGGYSDQLRAKAQSAEEEDPNIAHLANTAADRLQQAADYMRDTDLTRLRQDAADFAQRHPALFMGGMFVAGLLVGSLAKASVQSLREDARGSNDFDDPDVYGGYGAQNDGTEDRAFGSYASDTPGDPQI